MMQSITVFGDIHANQPALSVVLADMDAKGLENRYCLGDLVGYGVMPNEAIETIRDAGCATLMGNYDQGVGEDSDDCGCAYKTRKSRELGERSIAWSNAHTTAENKAYLRSLPFSIPVQVGELKILLVHGSPRRINEYLFEDRPDRSLERLFEGTGFDVLVCGHTHIPYWRVLPSGRQVVNAGSVGKPKDGDPRACYAVLQVEGRVLAVEFVRVEYDVEKTARAIEASEMPDEFAGMLRAGKG
jgi:putative phosphoesterase